MNWPNEFSKEIRARILHFLWRQWAQLGLASAQVEQRDNWIVDPEALILATCEFGRYDARLFDEMLDWLLINANFVNIPRAKSLKKRFAKFSSGELAAEPLPVCGNISPLKEEQRPSLILN